MLDPPHVNWTDVGLDTEAARRAADACDDFVAVIDEVVDWHERASADLLRTWRGGLADEFDLAVDTLRHAFHDRAEELRLQATALRDAADAAEVEQDRRERQRRHWREWDDHRRRVLLGAGR